jgi:diphosphomevalonate decarboxylase
MKMVTCTAPVNIAVIKYWGKRDETKILPINDSVSATLSSDQMHARTTVAVSKDFDADRIWLNGKEESVDNPRLANCLREVRKRKREEEGGGGGVEMLQWKVRICSENNFPTAAGLASSAAGYACLVYALCRLYGVKGEISELARQGSGSACRSVHGGFVRWKMGERADGKDSVSVQLKDHTHWPEMRVLICVATDARKKVASSKGMRLGVETSELLRFRAEKVVPARTEEMVAAIEARDFDKFADLTMRDSNQLHAVCLDTVPPCVYMNDTSHAVSDLVGAVNDASGRKLAAYTFDAGPNACVYLLEKDLELFAGMIKKHFPAAAEGEDLFFRGEKIGGDLKTLDLELPIMRGALKYVIATRVGSGPEVVEGKHLLDEAGMPKSDK